MRLVIALGMLTVFISCFFIFFTFHTLLLNKMSCELETTTTDCNPDQLNWSIVFGILIVGIFLFVEVLVVYLMIKSWVPGLLMYQPNS